MHCSLIVCSVLIWWTFSSFFQPNTEADTPRSIILLLLLFHILLPYLIVFLPLASFLLLWFSRCRVLRLILLCHQWRGEGSEPQSRLQVRKSYTTIVIITTNNNDQHHHAYIHATYCTVTKNICSFSHRSYCIWWRFAQHITWADRESHLITS